jgi:hypothetical protein
MYFSTHNLTPLLNSITLLPQSQIRRLDYAGTNRYSLFYNQKNKKKGPFFKVFRVMEVLPALCARFRRGASLSERV